MGAHSLPRPSRTDAGRIAGVGVLAALSLAGGTGVASAHGTDPGHDDDGDGHHGQTVSRTDDDAARTSTADPGGLCAVLGDVDLPGVDCTGDGATSRGQSVVTPGAADSGSTAPDADTQPRGVLAPQPSAGSTDGSQATGSTPNKPATPTVQNAGQGTAGPSQAQPKTTGNPVDAPARPGTTRTLPIGG